MICFFYRRRQHTAQHPATIDKERDMLTCTLITGWQTGIATYHRSPGILIALIAIATGDRNHLLGNLQAIHLKQNAGKLTVTWSGKNLSSLTEDVEANLRIGQCVLFQHMQTMTNLRITTLQKLKASWYCTE